MIIGISGKKNAGKDVIADYIIEEVIEKGVFFKKVRFSETLKNIACLLLNCTKEQLEDREFKEKELGPEWWKWEMKLDGGYGTISLPYLNTPNKVLKQYGNLKLVKFTPRLLLQLLGTECGREIIHPDLWVNATMAKYKSIEAYYPGDYLGECDNCGKGYLGAKGSFRCEECSPILPNWVISDVRFPNEAEAIKDKGGILIRVERFCYDSPEDFLVCNPNPELRKIGVQDYNINKTLSLEEITDIAKVHGYIPLSEQHESETALDTYEKFDHIITNNGTIEDLHKKVEKILLSI